MRVVTSIITTKSETMTNAKSNLHITSRCWMFMDETEKRFRIYNFGRADKFFTYSTLTE